MTDEVKFSKGSVNFGVLMRLKMPLNIVIFYISRKMMYCLLYYFMGISKDIFIFPEGRKERLLL